jgi:hypothetical protein
MLRECEDTNTHIQTLEPFLTNCDVSTMSQNPVEELQVAVLALAACFPKGKCLTITTTCCHELPPPPGNTTPSKFHNAALFDELKKRCLPSVLVWIVEQQQQQQQQPNDTSDAIVTTTVLVQPAKKATQHRVCLYDLERTSRRDDGSPLFLWTREPFQHHHTPNDLVPPPRNTTATTHVVDNTGNICVWDSERTLGHCLYHHHDEFVAACHETAVDHGGGRPWEFPPPVRHILELGTGMAGLSALALGLRLAQSRGDEETIQITLTDGNDKGVLNNKINRYLTKLQARQVGDDHPCHALDVQCRSLLWTTDGCNDDDVVPPCDVCLISDCVHFREFHAALACTVLRQLRLGGVAVFCQPTRGDSLRLFCRLLDAAVTHGLLSWQWWSPNVVEEMHRRSLRDPKYEGLYEESLHRPKLLLLVKLREMTVQDQQTLIAKHDELYWQPRRNKTARGAQ